MNIDWTVLIASVSVSAAIFFGLAAKKRNDKSDIRSETAALTTVAVKLEDIKDGVKEVKVELSDMKTDIRKISERLTTVEESCKSAHKRIDRFEKI